ncbi:unnamed protein product [Pleuronectes platessa]|uniref:Uncharacterized protein n=1 Tax=Pleuronectes platessa TaxID=8262 RepID=A0A9N7YDH7_PLEPL|nr:unnamed protein product [Pleuronectes platessa]
MFLLQPLTSTELQLANSHPDIIPLIKRSRVLPTVFQLIKANRTHVNSGMVQNAVALLCYLTEDSGLDLEPLHLQEPEAILSSSRQGGSRDSVPSQQTPESTQHTPHSHGAYHRKI